MYHLVNENVLILLNQMLISVHCLCGSSQR